MIITSWSFALFVSAVLALYFFLPRRAQIWWLLAASYGLYGTWSWAFPVGLLALTVANFGFGRKLWSGSGKGWMWGGITLNVLVLVLLKYANFFLGEVLGILDTSPGGTTEKVLQIVLPIGFSYRILENISFLVDASRRQLGEFPKLPDYALYSAWFPKLVSGPIERGKAFLTQLSSGRVVDNDVVARGLTLIIVGLCRKIVISDTLRTLLPGGLWDQTLDRGGWPLILWLLVDVFVVYNDFAGYTDIIRGVSSLFGIDLAQNFKAPFFSRNFSELWLRWHMSLSFWLRDYIYMPISRALLRRSTRPNTPVNLIAPPLIAMLVSALWHQAAWNMLAWGSLWGIFLFAGRIPTLWRPVIPPDKQPVWRQILGMLGVSFMLLVSNILFNVNVPEAWTLLGMVFGPGVWTGAMTSACLFILVSLGIDWAQHRSQDETVFRRWPLPVRSLILAVVVLALFLTTRGRVAEPFIYQFF